VYLFILRLHELADCCVRDREKEKRIFGSEMPKSWTELEAVLGPRYRVEYSTKLAQLSLYWVSLWPNESSILFYFFTSLHYMVTLVDK
jgi:hypothetical protein